MNDSNQNISEDFSDDAVRRFLLGQLSANEQPSFEQCLFLDSELEARVRLAEFDLADDYAFSRLRVEDRRQFEQIFLVSEDRKLKLDVSNALRDHFALSQAPVGTTTRFLEQLQNLLISNQLIARIAFGVALLALIIGGAWLLIKKEPRIKENIQRAMKSRRQQPSNAPRETHHATDNSMPQPRETPSPTVEVITLSPNVLIESGQAPSINLSVGAHDIVRVELVVKPEPSALYQAQLSTIEGQAVVTAESLKAAEVTGEKIDFDIPARLLKAGEYRITLRRVNDTSTETVASYYFRVR